MPANRKGKLTLLASKDKNPKVTLKAGMQLNVVTVKLTDPKTMKPAKLAARLCGGSGTCLALIDCAEREENFPPLRAGVAFGPAVNRWGDWFGSTVNVASRLTGRARPGAVLVTEPVREAAEDGFDWSAAGEKKLKGLQKPLKTYRPRPRGTKPD